MTAATMEKNIRTSDGGPDEGGLASTLFGGKLYRGDRQGNGHHRVTVNGRNLKARLDLRNHSPTGFAWGYSGSGPSQLALAICADLLGNDELAVRVYQRYKDRVIAALRDDDGPVAEWSITGDQVRATLADIARAEKWNPETFLPAYQAPILTWSDEGPDDAGKLRRLDVALHDGAPLDESALAHALTRGHGVADDAGEPYVPTSAGLSEWGGEDDGDDPDAHVEADDPARAE